MNVAIFASAFYPHIGGVEELVRQLARQYVRRGVGVIVLTNRWPRALPREEIYEGIPIHRLAMRMPEGSMKARFNYGLTHRAICRDMLGILRRHKVDLLHVQCVGPNGHYALIARRALGLPIVVTAQGERTIDADRIYERSPFLNEVLRDLLDEATHITACSRATLRDIEEFRGTPFGGRGSVVYNGIRPEDFADAPGYCHPQPYILGLGRMVVQKGFDILLEAFAKAAPASHRLLLAGDGPERPALEALCDRLRLRDHVRFLGAADRTKAAALFNGCSFFVLPSREEPMGIVNLEAMAAGKAVIATRSGGVPEVVIDGKTGVLVPPRDVGALSAAIRRLTIDPALRERLGAAGRERAAQFAWPEIASRYLEIYDRIPPSSPATGLRTSNQPFWARRSARLPT